MPEVPSGTSEPNEFVSDELLHFDYPGPNDSDLIIRTSDSHTFCALQLYVANSSPILRELIRSAPRTDPSDTTRGDKVVVKLSDRGVVICSLLTFIFPVSPVLPATPEMIMELLSVAQKYQMDAVLTHIRGAVSQLDPPFMHLETAFHHYALAQKYELRREAVQAARITLCHLMTLENLEDKINFMPGAYLSELWKYHERVRIDLGPSLLEFINTAASDLPNAVNGLRCRENDDIFPEWLDGYIRSIPGAPHLFNVIECDNARARHIRETANRRYHYGGSCSCEGISSQTICAFWEALTAVVHGVIEKADSSLNLVKEAPTFEYSDPSSVPLCSNTHDASIVLRSSDQVTFRVHKSVLAMSSPFFEDLLSLPQPSDGDRVDGLPVVQLSEGSGLLTNLISLLYPVAPVIPDSYDKVFALLAACQKYDMASIQSYIRAEIERGAFPGPVGKEAFRAYAIAGSMGLVTEMDHASCLSLEYPMTFESLGEGLRSFNGRALHDLLSYRKSLRKPELPPSDEDDY